MKENDFKTFETVELLSPIELAPIQGIENPLGLTETGKKETNKDTGSERFDDKKVLENEYFSETKNLDPNRFYYEEERLRKNLQEKKKKESRLILVGIIGVLCLITVYLSFMAKRNRMMEENSRKLPETYEHDYTKQNIDYTKQDPVYGLLEFDSDTKLEDSVVRIGKDIIEYTSPYERTLYFTVYPKMDKVTVEVGVEMVDEFGNSCGTVYNSKEALPYGKPGIIPITFYLDPDEELNGMAYNINWSSFASYQDTKYPEITNIEETPGCITVTIEGGNVLDRGAYVVLYKNGNVVSVLRNSVAYYLKEAEISFYTMNVDYDSFEVYY